jgi:S1-C subfamily serine protease
MFADAIARISASIFPIFFVQQQANQECVMGVCGTGFFVDDEGLFVTADHFMTPAPEGCTHYYYGLVPDEVLEPAVEIERLANDPERDLFVGRVRIARSRPVEMLAEPARPGDAVCLSGYPMAVVMRTESGGLVGNIRRYWQPTFVIDATRAVIAGRTYDGSIVQHTCLPGMSGGPMFDLEGRVRGIGMANLTRTIPEPGGPGLAVANGIAAGLDHLLPLLASARNGALAATRAHV